ncbi:cilia- and flagella-associated protein 418 isoform X2 [Mastacembelus armatus]|uniref:Cilia- and flagella-associated protein 418 n=1 Tax=Mastacembelus armatus TaxID=205130 RepID=A0A3Q3MS94_9TELE|nr:protein C8orf37 homolog isoform X2 [Mastacembelus armatus]
MDSGDDLDRLLDEVEEKFCRGVSVAAPARGKDDGQKQNRFSTKSGQNSSSAADDIDAFLEELLEDDAPELKTETKGPQVEKKLPCHTGGRRCFPVFVGGSFMTNGVGTATSKRSCDQLRCISCDFRVLMFDDCEWDSSCDYLFFRNNVPDRQKLRAKLKRSRGVRAYACQCSWFSCSEPTDLQDQAQLRWVCGKHLD